MEEGKGKGKGGLFFREEDGKKGVVGGGGDEASGRGETWEF